MLQNVSEGLYIKKGSVFLGSVMGISETFQMNVLLDEYLSSGVCCQQGL